MGKKGKPDLPKKVVELATDIPSIFDNVIEAALVTYLGLCLLLNLNPLGIFNFLPIIKKVLPSEGTEIVQLDKREKSIDPNAIKSGRAKQKERIQERELAKKQAESATNKSAEEQNNNTRN